MNPNAKNAAWRPGTGVNAKQCSIMSISDGQIAHKTTTMLAFLYRRISAVDKTQGLLKAPETILLESGPCQDQSSLDIDRLSCQESIVVIRRTETQLYTLVGHMFQLGVRLLRLVIWNPLTRISRRSSQIWSGARVSPKNRRTLAPICSRVQRSAVRYDCRRAFIQIQCSNNDRVTV